jgi:hypothetical protein
LLSARDPGGAKVMFELAMTMDASELFEVQVVVQGAAREVFRISGLRLHIVDLPEISGRDAAAQTQLFQEVQKILDIVDPSVIITSLSGPGKGIDEAIAYIARDRPLYSIQDFEGWVVDGFGRHAPNYFVSTEWARALTQRRPEINALVVGPLKYLSYAKLDCADMRGRERSRLNIVGAQIVTFYGQPAWNLSGYAESVDAFLRSMAELNDTQLLYRPHPKETEADRDHLVRHAREIGINVGICHAADPESSMAMSDLVVSIFSTICTDYLYLLQQSPSPLGCCLYLLFDERIRLYLKEDTGSELPAAVQTGDAPAVMHAATLTSSLRACLQSETRASQWHKAKYLLPHPTDAALNVISHLKKLEHKAVR